MLVSVFTMVGSPRKKLRSCRLVGLTLAAAYSAPCIHAQPSACASLASGNGPSIEEAGYIALGGIQQFVTIRGDDRSNPVLLHVHGGPGIAFSAFAAEFAAYEADFTVVQWDQRGAGCTFGRNGEAPELTLDAIASDGIELAQYLRGHLGNAKIVVLGHSFGSIAAPEMVRRAPGHFSFYVGTGQFGSFARALDSQIARLRASASAAGDGELTAELDTLAALDSQSLQKFGGVNRLLPSRMPAVDVAFMQSLQLRAAAVMAATELADWQAGRQTSGARLIQQIARVDLLATARRVEVPVLVIQGSDDLITPTDVARAYFDSVEAPTKHFVVIDGAGHFAHVTHAPQFLAALRDRVLAAAY